MLTHHGHDYLMVNPLLSYKDGFIKNSQLHKLKAAVCDFFGLKMIPNNFLSKYITSQCSKLSALPLLDSKR